MELNSCQENLGIFKPSTKVLLRWLNGFRKIVGMEATHMNKLQKAQKEVNRLWNLMCAEEGVPTDAKFVVFNSTNKYSVKYNKAVKKFFALKSTSSSKAVQS